MAQIHSHNNSTTPDDVKDSWGTPFWLIDRIGKTLNIRFTLDVCATEMNKKTYRWWGPDSENQDSLLIPNWNIAVDGQVNCIRSLWMNPPFSKKREFCRKASEEADRGGIIVVGLVPHSPESSWFINHVEATANYIYQPDGRVNFLDSLGNEMSGVNFPVCIPVWTPWSNSGAATYRRFSRK